MEIKDLKKKLKEYMAIERVSGYEKKMAYALKEDFEKYTDDVKIDKFGNCIATFEGSEKDALVLMVFAHMDTIGFVIRRIDPDGFIYVDRVGGVPEKVMTGTPVRVGSEDGKYYNGIFGTRAYHIMSNEEKAKADTLNDLFIDIGAKSEKELHDLGIEVGCPVAYGQAYYDLLNDRISGSYIDAAAGMCNLLQIAEYLKKHQPKVGVRLVGTVMEEYSARGAMMANRSAKCDMAISILGPGAADTPDQRGKVSNVKMNNGVGVTMFNFHGKGTLNGNIVHKGMFELLKKAAEEKDIPIQRQAARGALSDTAYLALENDGVPCMDLGTPDRYSHSPLELIDVKDLKQTGELICHFIDLLDKDFNLNRY
ncbi:MAG: M20/M25/M40 family metallo-hydrolase [Erysipelotrichaceae bacterium]|nr:M20/M25/M40 family metallo-hydrolase [Erysipelotrichaceae bacterium]